MNGKIFNARWDTQLKVCTFFAILIALVVMKWSIVSLPSGVGSGLLRVGICVVLAGAFLFAPKCYIIADKRLIIKRYAGEVIIPLDDIADVRALDASQMKYAVRTFGIGGFFGYYGRHYSKSLGSFKAYITDRSNCVLIQTRHGKRIVLSPENNLEFVEMIKALT